jgi:hypothetical protein
MSLAGYFFGNVDETGKLDNDLDEVFILKKKKRGGAMSAYLPVSFI